MIKNGDLSRKSYVPVVGLIFVFFLVSPYTVWGQGPGRIVLESTSSQKLSLIVGKSFIISLKDAPGKLPDTIMNAMNGLPVIV